MQSKEHRILELFYNEPTRQWHFEEILKEAGIARSKLAGWLRKFTDRRTIRRIKEKASMPYYIACDCMPAKRLYALNQFYESGLYSHLMNMDATVILFGSFSRGDWHKDSDIDIFIYGKADGLKLGQFEKLLQRDINVLFCKDSGELRKFSPDLIRSLINGDIIKGDTDFVDIHVPNSG